MFDNEAEARLIVLACSTMPGGTLVGRSGCFGARSRRPDRSSGALQYHCADAKKNELKPHLSEYFVIPSTENATFVAAMQNVMEVHVRQHDPTRPLVFLDATSSS